MMRHTVHINQSSAEVIPSLVRALEKQNLFVAISFDLQQARAGQTACDCPHHGTAPCTCQYAVLLINDPTYAPQISRTITVHGRDEQVWLSLLKRPTSSTKAGLAHREMESKLLDTLLNLTAASHAKTEYTGQLHPYET